MSNNKSKSRIQAEPASCQIYLVVETDAAAEQRLLAALAENAVASALIKPAETFAPDVSAIKALVELCQQRGIAALIYGDAALARTVRADGVHLPWEIELAAKYADARDILGKRFMVGVEIAPDAEAARHDAMELAEAGCDYVAFGPGANQFELVAWWAEIFEVPAVACDVTTSAAAQIFAAIGVEFVAVPLGRDTLPADAAAQLVEIAAAIASHNLVDDEP